jgi:hypothetical protein
MALSACDLLRGRDGSELIGPREGRFFGGKKESIIVSRAVTSGVSYFLLSFQGPSPLVCPLLSIGALNISHSEL